MGSEKYQLEVNTPGPVPPHQAPPVHYIAVYSLRISLSW